MPPKIYLLFIKTITLFFIPKKQLEVQMKLLQTLFAIKIRELTAPSTIIFSAINMPSHSTRSMQHLCHTYALHMTAYLRLASNDSYAPIA